MIKLFKQHFPDIQIVSHAAMKSPGYSTVQLVNLGFVPK